MHEWFMSREADPTAPYPPPPPGRGGQAVEAMLGDAVLKLLLVQHGVDHHRPEKNGKDEPDPGPLNQWIVDRSTNKFLYQRHIQLSRDCNLPRGLPPPKGHAHADPTAFEAWIARVFEEHGRSLVDCAKVVLPALGVEPAFLFERNPCRGGSDGSDSEDNVDSKMLDEDEDVDLSVEDVVESAAEFAAGSKDVDVKAEDPEA
mmetsp:Transcript_8868/g.40288  ORF Transcript_8868/g.40288 Transcript_8868/m.40288 type:complete len:202 (-) Transcript_8868:1656-2261(-)